jgi:hypothetical protein
MRAFHFNSAPSGVLSWTRKAFDVDLVSRATTTVASPSIGMPKS